MGSLNHHIGVCTVMTCLKDVNLIEGLVTKVNHPRVKYGGLDGKSEPSHRRLHSYDMHQRCKFH